MQRSLWAQYRLRVHSVAAIPNGPERPTTTLAAANRDDIGPTLVSTLTTEEEEERVYLKVLPNKRLMILVDVVPSPRNVCVREVFNCFESSVIRQSKSHFGLVVIVS